LAGVYSSLGFVNFMDQPSALTAYDHMYDGEVGGQPIKLREPQAKQLLAPRWPLNVYTNTHTHVYTYVHTYTHTYTQIDR
jgi:hypothetical protein